MLVLASAGYAEENAAKKQPNKEKVVLYCDLHCQGCCDKVMKNIAWEKGVKDLVCDLKSQSVTVTYDPRKTDLPTLLKAFERIGTLVSGSRFKNDNETLFLEASRGTDE